MLLACFAGGCALGTGRWQPGREPRSSAGNASGQPHQDTKSWRVPQIGGGDTPMYQYDRSYYVGIKQGASFGKGRGVDATGSRFFMEAHSDFHGFVAGDFLAVGLTLYGAGYGTSDKAADTTLAYLTIGASPLVKVRMTQAMALHLSGGPTYGILELNGTGSAEDENQNAAGLRGVAGLDLVLLRFGEADVVLSVEASYVDTASKRIAGVDTDFRGGAIAAEFVFAGF